jgi:hypothetical protein
VLVALIDGFSAHRYQIGIEGERGPKKADQQKMEPSHASGVVLGQVRAAGRGHELAAAKTLLKHVPIEGRVVTADALLTQRDISEQIVTDRGEYLFPIDSNQPALLADAEAALSPLDAGRPPA